MDADPVGIHTLWRMRRRMKKRIFAGIASATLLTGCGTEHEQAAPTEPPEPTKLVESLRLPFDKYELSQSQYNASQNATDILIKKCMQKKGLDWQEIERPTRVTDLTNRRRYGVMEIKVAQAYGYHAPIELRDPNGTKRADEQRLSKLSIEQQKAALGRDGEKETCNAQAARELKEPRVDYTLLNELSSNLLKESQNVGEVKEAMTKWSKCMKERGRNYTTPYGAMNDKKWWKDEKIQIGEEGEIKTATSDVKCKEESNLVNTWFAAERRLEGQGVRENKEYFQSLAEAKERHMSAVKEVLSQ
ncbi:hypothetical protein [Streptomyces sp. 7N604]|uniref:hypothetical protein n=1 Tax=Streptomyces sp. 7N604 TaxID=3457415 RepID=UPI003FD673B5